MLNARIKAHLVGVGVSVLTALLMVATEPRMAIVWDEGYTLGREESLRDWFRALRDPPRFAADWQPRPRDDELVQRPPRTPPPLPGQVDSRGKLLFDSDVLAWFWPFAREEPHGHPPFYALLGLVGDVAGTVVAGATASEAGADSPVQPDGGGDLFVPGDAVGLLAGGAGGGELGSPTEPVRPRSLRGL